MIKVGTIYALAQAKGGTGKTSISLQLAALLVAKGHEVLMLDADSTNTAIVDLMKARHNFSKKHPESQILPIRHFQTALKPADLIQRAIESAAQGFDVVIDCNNSYEELMLSSMGIANVIIIPSIPKATSIDAYKRMVPLIEATYATRKAHGVHPPKIYSVITDFTESRFGSAVEAFLEVRRDMTYIGRIRRHIQFEVAFQEGLAVWERFPTLPKAIETQRIISKIKSTRRVS